ncbi:hypothetical protein FG379_001260 [Cryptosporidium bovis]|uniref:uncharacterized protein n=1 Tax=Cryptosporidium bovis TaxID=310047 RepID=UPI003519DCB7|nr:hypothetical protein FG379_001260 [Cryptosporidium bovis]
MWCNTWLLSFTTAIIVVFKQKQAKSIDILNRENTYCNEHNLLDLVCVPRYNINSLIDELIDTSENELDFESPEPLTIYNKLEIFQSPLYSCNHPKSKLIELDSLHKSFMCTNVVELQKVLQCESGYTLKEVLIENSSNLLGYKESEIRLRTEKEKKYAIKSDKLCIKTVIVPVELSCAEGVMKDGFCVIEKTTNALYECPVGLSVTPKKWCGYIKNELNEELIDNVIRRTNPGCKVRKVHPWFKSTVTVECYDSKKYTIGITEDDWVNVIPAKVKCPKDYEIVYPKYSNKKEIDSIFVLPPICVSKRYFPRKLMCPGRLLRNNMIVNDRYIVEREINPTPFKQHVNLTHYSCEIQVRKKPSIVCPFYTDNNIVRNRNPDYTLMNTYFQNDEFFVNKIQKYQSGIDELIDNMDYSEYTNDDEFEQDKNKSMAFYSNENYKNYYHVYYRDANEDDLKNYLTSKYDYNLGSSYFPFRLNYTSAENTQKNNSIEEKDTMNNIKMHSNSELDNQYIIKVKNTNNINLNRHINNYKSFLTKNNRSSGEFFNNYQWNLLNRFFKVYVSNQNKFVANIPIHPISHEAMTVDKEYILNINLDPTYREFLIFMLNEINNQKTYRKDGKNTGYNDTLVVNEIINNNESIKSPYSENNIYLNNTEQDVNNVSLPNGSTILRNYNDNIEGNGNELSNSSNTLESISNEFDVIEENVNKQNSTQENTNSIYINTLNSIGTVYTDWEKSAKIYYMNLDLMRKNQILYSSINNYSHRKRFPYLYDYYSGSPRMENDFGHVRRPAISDHKYRYGSPSEQYYDYTGRYENNNINYYIHKYFNHTKPFRHSPGSNQYYNCVSINETSPIITCPSNHILLPRCIILDFIYSKIIDHIVLKEEEEQATESVDESLTNSEL